MVGSICSSATKIAPAQLFLNKGGKAVRRHLARGRRRSRRVHQGRHARLDYDNDGFTDLYVSNLNGRNFLYHNNRNNTFTEIGAGGGGAGARRTVSPTWFFDYDNDGWPDLFVTSYFTSVDESVRTYLGLPHNAATLKLYRNLRDGTFRDVTSEVGLDKVFMPMGANFGDIDNDGFLDIYLGTGNPSYALAAPERASAQQTGEVLRRRDRLVGHRRAAQGTRYRLCRPGQRRRRGHRRRNRRSDAGRRASRCGCSKIPATGTTGST